MHISPLLTWTILLLIGLCSSCSNIKVTSANMDTNISSRSNNFQKLIVNEYDSKHENYHYYVVSYNFREGTFVSKDTLFEGPKLSVSLHESRYLISYSGPIFDMATKKVIWESNGMHMFTEARGDTIFYVNMGSDPRSRVYYSLDLKNLNYAQVPKGSYKISNRDLHYSPDRQRVVYSAYVGSGFDEKKVFHGCTFDIVFRGKHTGDTTIVHKVNSASLFNYDFSRVAIFWLNNSSFLYDHHHFYLSADNKGYHNIEIRKYDFDTGSDQLLCRIDSVGRTAYSRGDFQRDAIGQLHYRASNAANYLLNTTGDQALIDPFFYMNKDFSYNDPLKKGMTIRYQDSIIVEDILGGNLPVATNHAIAIIYRDEGPWLGYPKGIKIWSIQQNEWLIFDVPWANSIIGWMEE